MTTIRIHIKGSWSAKDFSEYFSAINHIYSIFSVVNIERNSLRDWENYYEEFDFMFDKMMRSSRRFRHFLAFQRAATPGFVHLIDASNMERSFEMLESSECLQVRQLNFASPGYTDLSGLGKAMEHVKDLILKLIDIRLGSEERRINNEIREEDRKAAALKNLKEQISILKELGYSESEIRAIVATSATPIDNLLAYADRGMITSVTDNTNEKN